MNKQIILDNLQKMCALNGTSPEIIITELYNSEGVTGYLENQMLEELNGDESISVGLIEGITNYLGYTFEDAMHGAFVDDDICRMIRDNPKLLKEICFTRRLLRNLSDMEQLEKTI